MTAAAAEALPLRAEWRTLLEGEADYVKDLAMRWQTYSFVAAGTALVLGVIAASMRGYLAGPSRVTGAVAYGLAGALFGTGGLLCFVLQLVGRRLLRDVVLARVDAWEGDGHAVESRKYVMLNAGAERFLVLRGIWERAGLPLGPVRVRLEHTPVSRLVLTLNGSPTYR